VLQKLLLINEAGHPGSIQTTNVAGPMRTRGEEVGVYDKQVLPADNMRS